MSNIFQAQGALPDSHPTYSLRHEADNNAFIAALNSQILHVIAPRQVGKTSLLKRLKRRLEDEGWRCPYIDLSTLMNLPMPTWYTELGNMLARDLTPGQAPALTNQVEMRHYLLTQALPWPKGQPQIALLFDEVESILKVQDVHGKPFSDTFFMTLRNLYIERDTYEGVLALALAGSINPGDLVIDQSISPFNVGQKVSLDDFTPIEARVLTEHLSDLGLTVEDSVHQGIYNWTNGHPYLTQCICFELEKIVHNNHLAVVTMDDVPNVVEQTFLNPANPLLQDSNLRHTAKMLACLSEPASKLWSRLEMRETVLVKDIDKDTYLELYLTGAVKAQGDCITIRNRIYEEALTKKVNLQMEEVKSVPQISVEMGIPKKVDFEMRDMKRVPHVPFALKIPTSVPAANRNFLDSTERNRIIDLIELLIDNMSEFEIRNLLTNSKIPNGATSHIKYGEGPRSITHAIVWKLERMGSLGSPDYHALGSFLTKAIEVELLGYDAACEIVALIFKHGLILDRAKIKELSSRFQIPSPALTAEILVQRQVSLSHLPERLRSPELRERLESLYNTGIRHYTDPKFFSLGAKAIRSVCRIEFHGYSEGTGFLVAPDLILTNYHVFMPYGYNGSIHERAKQCRIRFGAVRNREDEVEPGELFKLDGEHWYIAQSKEDDLDYLLVKLDRFAANGVISPVSLTLRSRHIQKDEYVNIIHHPRGGPMEVSLRYNQIVLLEGKRIYYLADTEEGSSGSPVFDDDWSVVALHRSGGEKDETGYLIAEANAGIPIELIMKEIGPYLNSAGS